MPATRSRAPTAAPGASGDVVLVHWHDEEAAALAGELRAAGFRVRLGPGEMRDLKAAPPIAVVISLRRLPSHGREVADAIWYTKWGRAIPIVFVDGEPEKVAATRARFAAAKFVAWKALPKALAALAAKGDAPVETVRRPCATLHADDVRVLALALPGAEEGAHMGHPDFRVRGRIFASLPPDGRSVSLKITGAELDALVVAEPATYRAIWGGRWLAVDLATVSRQALAALLADAHASVRK